MGCAIQDCKDGALAVASSNDPGLSLISPIGLFRWSATAVKYVLRYNGPLTSHSIFVATRFYRSDAPPKFGTTSVHCCKTHGLFKRSEISFFVSRVRFLLNFQCPISHFRTTPVLTYMSGNDQDENQASQTTGQKRPNTLELGPRKKPYVPNATHNEFALTSLLSRCFTDPLVHHGRHFGRTVHAMCNFPTLLNNGIMRIIDQATTPDVSLTAEYSHLPSNELTCT